MTSLNKARFSLQLSIKNFLIKSLRLQTLTSIWKFFTLKNFRFKTKCGRCQLELLILFFVVAPQTSLFVFCTKRTRKWLINTAVYYGPISQQLPQTTSPRGVIGKELPNKPPIIRFLSSAAHNSRINLLSSVKRRLSAAALRGARCCNNNRPPNLYTCDTSRRRVQQNFHLSVCPTRTRSRQRT